MRPVIAFLGLGSNLGDREAQLRTALERLSATPGVNVLQTSSLRETAPSGGPAQGPFLNGACKLATTLSPHALLSVCQALELAAGRQLPAQRHAPRPLDLDLLLYGELVIDTRELVVPHPRLFEREFVLQPLQELGVDVAALPRPERPRRLEDPGDFAALCSRWQAGGCVVGLVPTMGALHLGHQSLMQRARQECDRVAVTIFVNPLQFGPGEDLAAYPRDLAGDLRLCAEAAVDAVFVPEAGRMYDPAFCSHIAVGSAATTMEGALRPLHFSGVATVVARLFALSRPQRGYFGKKDAQQVAVIRRMTEDLGFPTRIVECPIVREADGLALSSRNVYLGAGDRQAATVLFRALGSAQAQFRAGERDKDRLLACARAVIAAEPRARLDYLELRAEADLQPLPPGPVQGGRLLVAAAFLDGRRPVRLLDNLSLVEPV